MNKHAKLWIEKLRSGEFEQGQRRLRNTDDSYCCLGVACELYFTEHPDTAEWRVGSEDVIFIVKGAPTASAALPQPVVEWLGMTNSWGSFTNEDGNTMDLTVMNDSGATFTDIADVIESEPKGLFV